MTELERIVHEQRMKVESEEQQRQFALYIRRALEEGRQNGFYVASPLGTDKMEYPFSVNLHPAPISGKPPRFPHKHDFFEMTYVLNGSCHNVFDNYEIILNQGDLLLMNPEVIHSLYTTSKLDVVFNFLISEETFRHTFFTLMSDNIISNFVFDYLYQIQKVSNYLILNCDNNPSLPEVLNRLIIEYYNRLPGYQTILEFGLVQAFSFMARSCMQQFSAPTPYSSKLGSIMLYILKNYATVTLKDVAYTFAYNEKYVSRLIRSELNVSFSELVRSVRLQHAAVLLKKTTMPIDRIAATVGYQNISHFYKIFYDKYEMTPMGYRTSGNESA